MRGSIEGLETPHPLGRLLPALYQEDDLAQRLTAALDEVLAPVLCTLDNRAAYFDARLAPSDFLAWLAEWVGAALDETSTLERRRALVSRAGQLHAWRGTRRGLAEHLELLTGVVPEIEDSGGTAWSATAGAGLPGSPGAAVVVRVRRAPERTDTDLRRLEAVVRDATPAHVALRIEVSG